MGQVFSTLPYWIQTRWEQDQNSFQKRVCLLLSLQRTHREPPSRSESASWVHPGPRGDRGKGLNLHEPQFPASNAYLTATMLLGGRKVCPTRTEELHTEVSTSSSYDRVTPSAPPPTLCKYSPRTVNTTKSFKDDNNNEHSDWCHLSNDCWSGRPLPLAYTVSSHPDYSLTLTITHTRQMKTLRRSEPPPRLDGVAEMRPTTSWATPWARCWGSPQLPPQQQQDRCARLMIQTRD